jgi:hypothetical protein
MPWCTKLLHACRQESEPLTAALEAADAAQAQKESGVQNARSYLSASAFTGVLVVMGLFGDSSKQSGANRDKTKDMEKFLVTKFSANHEAKAAAGEKAVTEAASAVDYRKFLAWVQVCSVSLAV